MIWNRISDSLQEKGFIPSTKDKRIAEFLIKITDDNKMYICNIIKNIGGSGISANIIVESAVELERKFLLSGYDDVSVMHIIVTDRDEDIATLEEKGVQFWIVDVRSNKFMIFENQTENYFGIKEVIEDALQNEKDVPQVKGIKDYFYFKEAPFITVIMIILNIILFVGCEIFGNTMDTKFMIDVGALGNDFIYQEHQYYRLITSMFLHFGFLHIANNMFMLGIVGSRVEKWLGHIRFFLVYITSGLGGGIASVIYHTLTGQAVISAGASGAIYGILGALLVMYAKNQDEEFDLRQLIVVVVLIVLGGIQGEVDYAAHIGGLVIGSVSALALSMGREDSQLDMEE